MFCYIAFLLCMPDDQSEPSRIVEAKQLVFQHQIEMIVRLNGSGKRHNAKVAGHAQMNDQRAMIETDKQILASSTRTANRATGQQPGKIFLKRHAQTAMPQHDILDDTPLDMRGDAATRYFDFR